MYWDYIKRVGPRTSSKILAKVKSQEVEVNDLVHGDLGGKDKLRVSRVRVKHRLG